MPLSFLSRATQSLHLTSILTALLVLMFGIIASGCATIVMSKNEKVEFINIPPSGAQLYTEQGVQKSLTQSQEWAELPRSRHNVAAILSCQGKKQPLELKTHPNIAFVLGNTLLFFFSFIGLGIDALGDFGWNYQQPVDVSFYCSSSSPA